MTYKLRLQEPIALALLVITAACHSDRFPDAFAFGTAIAGFQVDMGCPTVPASTCDDPNSDWYRFVTSTVTLARPLDALSGDPPSKGPGFFELYADDLDRAHGLGLDSFRFSFEWSRVFPKSTIGVEGHDALLAIASRDGLDYYHRLLSAIRARKMRPLVTVNHYTLPTWIHDGVGCNVDLDRCSPRGWLEPSIVGEIAKYAGFVAAEFGGEVDLWATENEPFAVIIAGYLLPSATRTNPPAALLRPKEARTALFAMIDAHARMYDAIKENDRIDADGDGRASRVGIVYNIAPVAPKDPTRDLDQRAAANLFHIYDELFLDAVLLGDVDQNIDRKTVHRADLANRCDYLGINYYTRAVVEGELDPVLPDFSSLTTFNPLTLQQGATYARGMYESVMFVKSRYPGVPMVITENGADSAHDDVTPFLVTHLEWLKKAIDDGAKVEGYHWWSLMDNYEWNHGMSIRMGLYAVDGGDPAKKRTARPVSDALRRIATAHAVPADLAKLYPVE
jgi:beta-glucosidase/6-phospho-beta-glucosidase/beta-galactosidase